MKNTPLSSMIAEFSDRLFIVDTNGKTLFFPWGEGKQGYYVKNENVVRKAKKFYNASFLVCFITLMIALSLFGRNFWAILSSIGVCFGGWYLAYYLYTSRIVKSLPAAKVSLNDIIFEKLSGNGVEEEAHRLGEQFPAQWYRPISKSQKDPFSGFKNFWFRISPGQWAIASILIGFLLLAFTINDLTMFFVFFLWGLGSFIIARESAAVKEDAFLFFRWGIPAIAATIICWIIALASLYNLFVTMIE